MVPLAKGEVKWLVQTLGLKPNNLTKSGSFSNRLRVQKVAFLLKHLQIEPFSRYGFGLYLRGPYSPALAKEYYDLGKVVTVPVVVDKKTAKLMEWFGSKDPKWLEVASSIMAIKDKHVEPNADRLYSTLTLSKPWVTKEMFESVRAELASEQL